MTSLVAQTVKRLPAMQETRVPSLGREDSLEKEMATHSSLVAWKIPWTETMNHMWLFMGDSRTYALTLFHYRTPRDVPNPGIELVSLTSPALVGGFP